MLAINRTRAPVVSRPSGEILYDVNGQPVAGATSHAKVLFATGTVFGAFFGAVGFMLFGGSR